MTNPNMPRQEQFRFTENLRSRGSAVICHTGKLILAAFEGAVQGALEAVSAEREIHQMEIDDREMFFDDVQGYANDPSGYQEH